MGRGRKQAGMPAWGACLALLLATGLLMPMPAKANGNMPDARAGAAYSFDVDGGASGRSQFAIYGVYLPSSSTDLGQVPGLSMDPATGELHGIPTSVGSYHVYFQFQDAALGGRANEMWLTVSAPLIALSPGSLPQGTVDSPYRQALSPGGGTAPYSMALSSGDLPAGVSFTGGQLQGTPTVGGTFSFAITVSDSSTGSGAPFSSTFNYTLVIAKHPQSISFGAQSARTFAPGDSFALNPLAAATSGLPVAYSSQSPQVCTIIGSTVTIVAAGNCRIAANQSGNAIYAPAPAVVATIAIGKASQGITGFASAPAAPTYAPAGTFEISAIGGPSGQPVLFASATPMACSVSGDTVTMLSAGNCGLTADQAGDANYNAAPQATLDVTIGAAAQAIGNFVSSPAAPVFAPNGTFILSASGGGSTSPIVFGSVSPAVCTVNGSLVTMRAAGTCALTADQAADANYNAAPQATLDVTIGAAAQAIGNFVSSPAAPVFAPNGTFILSANGGGSTSPIVFGSVSPAVCTVNGSLVTMRAAGTCALTADQAADANYSAAPQATLDVVIGKAAQAIGNFVSSPAAPVFAPNGTFTLSANGGASTSPIVFGSVSPAVCTVNGSLVTMRAAGTCALTADQAADANYSAAPQATLDVVIGKAAQAIGNFVSSPAAPVFAPNGTFTLSANGGASTSPIVFGSVSPAVCTVNGSLVTMRAAGTCALTADQAADANYSAAPQATLDVVIGKGAQAIDGFVADPAAPVFAPNGTFTLSANGGASTSPIVFGSTSPATCAVQGSTVTMLGAGECTLTANQAADPNYNAAPQATLDVVIGKAAQAIGNFVSSPAAPVFAPNGTFTLSANGGASTSPIVFGSTSPATCAVQGSTVTMLGAGECTLTANQAADPNYNAAPQATLDVTIGAAAQAIGNFVSSPAAPVFAPNGTFTLSANGGASTSPIVFGSVSPAVCTVNGSLVTMRAAGTCALTADQAADANYSAAPQATLDVVIGKAAQAIGNFVSSPAAPVFAPNGTFTLSANGGASTSPIVFGSTSPATCAVQGSTVTMLGAGECTLTADQAGDANYEAAPQVSLGVTVSAAAQAIGNFVSSPAAPVFAPGGTFTLSATGGASTSPVVFGSASPAVCSVSGSTVAMLAAGTCALTADQAGDANYSAARQVTLDVAIGAAPQAITDFAADPGAPVFAPNGVFSVSATGGASMNPVTFASASPGTCTVAGKTVTMVAAGMCALTADQAADSNYGAAPQARLDVAIMAAAPTLSWSTSLEKVVGDSDFELPIPGSTSSGEFTYSSSDAAVATIEGRTVTIVGPGVATLLATQAAHGNYTAGAIGITLTVGARPDPTSDVGVVDSLQAQADASRRFATAQQGNIRDRLRQLRSGDGGNPSHNGLALNLVGATGRSLLLPMGANGMSSASTWLPAGWGVWTAGSITIGERDGRNGGAGFDFRSDGLSAGVDRKVGRWVVGFAAGAGWDDTDFTDGRSTTGADQRSFSGYGLWRGDHWFVDGMLGWGRLDFEIHRWSEVAAATATATRSGDQAFGSLELGYEQRDERSSLAGYGRYDGSHTRLDAYEEAGLGAYDLAYREQEIEGSSLALGVEGSYRWLWKGRKVQPSWMLEYREALGDDGKAVINYVLRPLASDYVLGLRNTGDNGFAMGGGVDIELGRRWQLTLSYRHEKAGAVASDSVGLRLMFRPQK